MSKAEEQYEQYYFKGEVSLWRLLRWMVPFALPYWHTFLLGVLLSFVFTFNTGFYITITHSVVQHFTGKGMTALQEREKPDMETESAKSAGFLDAFTRPARDAWHDIRVELATFLDNWLPKPGRQLTGRQIVGGFFLLPGVALITGLCGWLSGCAFRYTILKIKRDVRLAAFGKAVKMPPSNYSRQGINDIMSRATGEPANVALFLNSTLVEMVQQPMLLLWILINMLSIDMLMTVLALCFVPTILFAINALGKRIQRLAREGVSVNVRGSHIMLETFSNVRITKAFGLEEHQVDQHRSNLRRNFSNAMRMFKAQGWLNPLNEVLTITATSLVLVIALTYGRTLEDLASFMVGIGLMYAPIRALSIMHMGIITTKVSLNRVYDLIHSNPDIVEGSKPRALASFERNIEFQEVSVEFVPGQPVLKDFTFKIERGQKVGISGPSGGGKTTLLNLMLRFIDPTRGHLSLDGHDLRSYRLQDLRRQMALVSQQTLLFANTVRYNLLLGRDDVSDDDLWKALRNARADDFVRELPEGIETHLGSRGGRLSGGQRQRISIARSFLHQAPILLLDEATAALDPRAEREVQEAIDQLAQQCTVLCVAHRLSTLANMDEIIVVDQGQIVEKGGYRELIETEGGLFAAMAKQQEIY